jgi:hypothetical protein
MALTFLFYAIKDLYLVKFYSKKRKQYSMSNLLEPILPRHLLVEKFPPMVEENDITSLNALYV